VLSDCQDHKNITFNLQICLTSHISRDGKYWAIFGPSVRPNLVIIWTVVLIDRSYIKTVEDWGFWLRVKTSVRIRGGEFPERGRFIFCERMVP
jgi:hypothetical protein